LAPLWISKGKQQQKPLVVLVVVFLVLTLFLLFSVGFLALLFYKMPLYFN
jgi:RsiW-degrading membrane proteinase PrsW (M82 family)